MSKPLGTEITLTKSVRQLISITIILSLFGFLKNGVLSSMEMVLKASSHLETL